MPKSPRFPPSLRSHPVRPAAPQAARVIEVLAYPAVQLLDVTGPLQVFATANEQVVQAGGTAPYVLRVVAKDRSRVAASSGLEVVTDALPRSTAALDTLVVAGGPGVDLAAADPALLAWLRRRVRKARRVASVCTEQECSGAD